MLKVLTTVNNRRTLFLGLDRVNTGRLHDDQPIAVDVQALVAGTSYDDVQDVVLFAGETLADLHAQLAAHIPGLPPADKIESAMQAASRLDAVIDQDYLDRKGREGRDG